jgi:hypothetical protein
MGLSDEPRAHGFGGRGRPHLDSQRIQPQPNSVGGQGPTLRGQDSQVADAGEDDRDGTMAILTPSTNVAIVCATSRRASGRLMPGLLLEGGRDLVGGGGTPRCSAAHA